MVRVGLPASFGRFGAVARELSAPVLVSANAFWKPARGRFWRPSAALFDGLDVALDSAGFVAMARYGGFRWTVADYVALAGALPWAWWAQMDLCCEPEIAADGAAVDRRRAGTVALLAECKARAADAGLAPPMPVLQGWAPADYLRCADAMGDLPALVGVGSVCRRALAGENGAAAVIDALDRRLAPHVRLHLFGVKGDIAARARSHPRIASVDSMAWDMAARRQPGASTFAVRAAALRRWYRENTRPGVGWQSDLVGYLEGAA